VAEPDPDFVGYKVDTEQIRDIEAKHYYKEKCDLEKRSKTISRKQGLTVMHKLTLPVLIVPTHSNT